MKTPSIRKNLIFDLISQMVRFLVPMVVTPYISRVFSVDGIGIYSYTTANVTFFTLFSMLGISGHGRRQIAANRDDREETTRIFFELQFLHFLTFLLTSGIYLILVVYSVKYRGYYLAHFITLLSCLFDISWFFQAFESFGSIAIRNICSRVLLVIFVFTFIHSKDDLILYIFLNALTVLIENISLWPELKKLTKPVRIRTLNPWRHMKEVMIFFIPTISASVYSVLDKSVINWVTQDENQNGYYEQAYKVLQVGNAVVQTLATVSGPRMTHIFSKGNMVELKQRINHSLCIMLLIAFPVAFGIAAITPVFVPAFFGSGYDQVTYILYIFMPLVVILGFSVYLDGLYLVPIGKRKESECR